MDGEYLMEAMSRRMMEFLREEKRRNEAQQAVDKVVERMSYFNGAEVQSFLKVYNAEMDSRGVDKAMRLEYFCRVVSQPIFKDVEELLEAHDSWATFEKALLEEYDYERLKGQDRRNFDQWVTSAKTHQGATQAFVDFEHHFSQLSEREQRLVGVDKVLMFVKSIDRMERMAIGLKLEEDDGANGLIEDWSKVESVCRLHDKGQARISTTTRRPMRDDRRGTRCNNAPPTKEMKLKRETKPRRMVIEEEETSQQMRVNEVADTKALVRYDGTEREGVKQVTFLSYKETTAKEEADDSRTANATSREDKCFGTRIVYETSGDDGASMRKACMIEGEKVFESEEIEEVAMTNDIESEVAMDESTTDSHVDTFFTLVPETSAVAPMCQRETGETEGGDGKTKAQHKEEEDRGRKDIPTPILETSAVVHVRQRETGETECVDKKEDDRKGDEEDKVNVNERRDSFTLVPETSAVETVCRHKTEDKGGGEEETIWLEASIHGGKDMADVEAKDEAAVEFDGEVACGKEGRVENRLNRKTIRPGFRPERRKIHMGADRPGPTRPKPDSAKIDRTIPIQKGADPARINRSSPTRGNVNADEGQPSQEAIGGDRSGQGQTRPNRRSTRTIYNTQLKTVSVRSGQESNRRTRAVDEGRAVVSTTSFGRSTTTDRGRRCERRIWWIGWLRWFGWKDWA